MTPRQDRSTGRMRGLVAVAALAVVAIAARMPATPSAPQPATMPPAEQAMGETATTTMQPDTMVLMIDTATVMMEETAAAPMAAAPAAPASWPVDPVTGQTLINGIPVVGRVFIQQKVDGLVKIKDVATYQADEALPPEAAVVSPNRAPLPPTAVRRQRNPMVQSTLWSLDDKPSLATRRHYYPTTSGASLGQR